MKYRVIRPHFGDRQYNDGETRVADPADVKHLVPHVLQPISDEDADELALDAGGETSEFQQGNPEGQKPISGDEKADKIALNKAEPTLKDKSKG